MKKTKQLPSAKPMVIKNQQLASYTKEESIQLITSSRLEPSEKEIALASLERKVKDCAVDELTVFMTGLIERTHINCGQKVDEDYVDLYLDELISDLKKYNTGVSLQEIELAFKGGYKGAFGEWFGLNNKTYFGWINAFTFCEKRTRAKSLLRDRVLPEVELSENQKEMLVREGCLKSFELFKEAGFVDDIGNVTYNYLARNKVINYTPEQRNEFKEKAREKILRESQVRLTEEKRDQTKKQIRDFMANVEKNLEDDAVVTEAKKIALNLFFFDLQSAGEELKIKLNYGE